MGFLDMFSARVDKKAICDVTPPEDPTATTAKLPECPANVRINPNSAFAEVGSQCQFSPGVSFGPQPNTFQVSVSPNTSPVTMRFQGAGQVIVEDSGWPYFGGGYSEAKYIEQDSTLSFNATLDKNGKISGLVGGLQLAAQLRGDFETKPTKASITVNTGSCSKQKISHKFGTEKGPQEAEGSVTFDSDKSGNFTIEFPKSEVTRLEILVNVDTGWDKSSGIGSVTFLVPPKEVKK